MAIVKKFTVGIQPFSKMFRVSAHGGAIADAVLRLRTKTLTDDFFNEVGFDAERKTYRVSNSGSSNILVINEENITFTKDYYNSSGGNFDYSKFLNEFKIIWTAVNNVMPVYDIRRIGIEGEYRYSIGENDPSSWLRKKLIHPQSKANRITEKFILRFEEREIVSSGTGPNINKSDFINVIYSYYDSSTDYQHAEIGFVSTTLDIQRYFTPVLNSNVGDEIQKLYKHYSKVEIEFDGQLKSFGATSGKK